MRIAILLAALLAPPTVAAAESCLSPEVAADAKVIRPKAAVPAPYDVTLPPGTVLDLRGQTFRPGGKPNGPDAIILRQPNSVCVIGPHIIGQQSRAMTWRVNKGACADGCVQEGGNYDYDGINAYRSTGPVTIEDAYFENVHDAFGPPKALDAPASGSMIIRRAHAVHVRDDFIENDGCLALTVEDSLIENAHMLFSATPGAKGPCTRKFPMIIKNVVASLSCKPDRRPRRDGAAIPGGKEPGDALHTSCPPGQGVGHLFKFKGAGPVDVTDSVFWVPAVANSGPTAMAFPAGTYRNVTLVWTGPGNYPGKLPAQGVMVTRDVSVWERARIAWLERHAPPPVDPRLAVVAGVLRAHAVATPEEVAQAVLLALDAKRLPASVR